jgi:hypothetical protein
METFWIAFVGGFFFSFLIDRVKCLLGRRRIESERKITTFLERQGGQELVEKWKKWKKESEEK